MVKSNLITKTDEIENRTVPGEEKIKTRRFPKLTLETYLPLAGVAERLVCYTETRIAARPRVDL